MLSVAYKVIAR